MGDAVFRRQQHPDDQLLVAEGALRADAQVERADTEGEITDADMRQPAAQGAAPELHDVDMRTLHGLMQSLKPSRSQLLTERRLPMRIALIVTRA